LLYADVVTIALEIKKNVLLNYMEEYMKDIPHSWSRALLEKLPIVQLLEHFPAFYGNRRFITVFTRALHRSLS
jgi:hypothetical protein